MIKNAFVERNGEGKIIVRVEGHNVGIFENEETALEWAFSIGYHVYKKVETSRNNNVCWVKYTQHN